MTASLFRSLIAFNDAENRVCVRRSSLCGVAQRGVGVAQVETPRSFSPVVLEHPGGGCTPPPSPPGSAPASEEEEEGGGGGGGGEGGRGEEEGVEKEEEEEVVGGGGGGGEAGASAFGEINNNSQRSTSGSRRKRQHRSGSPKNKHKDRNKQRKGTITSNTITITTTSATTTVVVEVVAEVVVVLDFGLYFNAPQQQHIPILIRIYIETLSQQEIPAERQLLQLPQRLRLLHPEHDQVPRQDRDSRPIRIVLSGRCRRAAAAASRLSGEASCQLFQLMMTQTGLWIPL
ncbi:hypothetical protein CRUP_017463 [Coryphaenoides rupestris]|nr:hypothetical protein CRUP_017463 [Coryphaenoides rupestris]